MEQIYTIPVNEAFEETRDSTLCNCPICRIYEKLEKKEIDIALGPAMMEPSTRIDMNKKGFCKEHLRLLMAQNSKLSLALIFESHLDEIKNKMKGNFFTNLVGAQPKKSLKTATGLNESCYVCDKINFNFERMIETALYLYSYDKEFREKLVMQKYICLPHYQLLLEVGKARLDKKKYQELSRDVNEIENKYLEKLKEDVSWFCKKFDYRYDSEPWKDSRDAIERTVRFLGSGYFEEKKK